jgi:hypothetical protein
MTDKAKTLYPHRRNRDGSFDSICLTCFMTVATAKTEIELAESDAKHICESALLAERGMFQTPHPMAAS